MKKTCAVLLVFLFNFLLMACSSVSPWERGILAKTEMAWEPYALRGQLEEHV